MSETSEPNHIRAVERWALIFSAVLIGGAMVFCGPRAQLGTTLGSALMLINLWIMRRLGSRLLRLLLGPRASVTGIVVLFNGKLLLLAALMYLCIRHLPVDPVAFILGVSVLPGAIVAHAIDFGMRRTEDLKPSTPHEEG